MVLRMQAFLKLLHVIKKLKTVNGIAAMVKVNSKILCYQETVYKIQNKILFSPRGALTCTLSATHWKLRLTFSSASGVTCLSSRYTCLSFMSRRSPSGQSRHESLSITSATTISPVNKNVYYISHNNFTVTFSITSHATNSIQISLAITIPHLKHLL